MARNKELYNSEQKELYLKSLTSPRAVEVSRTIMRIFIERESELQKDLCFFTNEEIAGTLNNIAKLQISSKKSYISLIRQYVDWCVENGYAERTVSFDKTIILSLLDDAKTFVYSPAHLQKILDDTFLPVESHTSDVQARLIVWLYYMGLSVKEQKKLRKGNVDFVNKLVRVDDKVFTIYDEALPAFYASVTLTHFISTHKGYEGKPIERIKGGYLCRGIKTNYPNSIFMHFYMPQNLLIKSGIFYRTMLREQQGFVPDFDYLKKKPNFSYTLSEISTLNSFRARIKHEYKAWKAGYLEYTNTNKQGE